MYVRLVFGIVMCLSCLAVAQVPAAAPTATGDTLLSEGKYQEALEAYLAVTRADSRNAAAQHGAGRAYDALGQSASAVKAFERAYALAPKDRAIAHNTAVILFRTGAQPRAIKIVKDYLTAVPQPPDEVMLESLRYMLEHANDETRKAKPFIDAEAFSSQYARSIERQRPGFSKWGSGWINAKDAAANVAANKRIDAEAEVIADRIKLIERDIKNLERRTPELESLVRRGFESKYAMEQHLDQIRQFATQRADAMRDRLAVLDRKARPAPAIEPTWIAMGTPAPELPSLEALAAQSAPPPPPPEPIDTQPPDDKPVRPGDEPPVAHNPPPEPPAHMPPPPERVVKRVTRYGVAFAISEDTLVTSHELVNGAFDITVQSSQGTTDEAKVIKSDAKTGLCLVRITKLKAAALRLAGAFDGGAVECIGMPNVDLFKPNASAITGTSPAPAEPYTVKLEKSPRLAGAPLLSAGQVVGVTLANRDTEADAVPAVTLKRLADFVGADTGKPGAFTNEPKAAVFQVVATHESK